MTNPRSYSGWQYTYFMCDSNIFFLPLRSDTKNLKIVLIKVELHTRLMFNITHNSNFILIHFRMSHILALINSVRT
jgi:hypothetical protein